MHTFFKLAIVQTRLYLREPMAVFFTLLMGPMLLVMMGCIFGSAPRPELNGLSQMDISVPSYMALVIGITGLTSIPVILTTRRETGALRRLSATPLRPLTYFLADALAPFLVILCSTALLILLGFLIYHVRFEGQWPSVAAGVILYTASCFALGYALAGMLPNARLATVLGNAIIIPMNIFSGALMPIELMPQGIQHFANFLPLTHGVSLLRGLWLGEPWSAHLLEVAVLGGMLVVGLVVAALTFKWE